MKWPWKRDPPRDSWLAGWNAALAKAEEVILHAPLRESAIVRLRLLLAQRVRLLRKDSK